jgi:hypothetical protein
MKLPVTNVLSVLSLRSAGVLALCAAAPLAFGKLPPLTAEQQIKADDAKAKAAWTDKVSAYQLCQAMDRTAQAYFKSAKGAGKDVHPPVATPACTDPGPYQSTADAQKAKPLEASGAHSPAATATTPPSSKPTQVELQGKKK